MRSNSRCNAAVSGAVYSTNSNPSVPIGFSQSSIAASLSLAPESNIVSYATIWSQAHDGPPGKATHRGGRLDHPTGLGQLFAKRASSLGSIVRPSNRHAAKTRQRGV